MVRWLKSNAMDPCHPFKSAFIRVQTCDGAMTSCAMSWCLSAFVVTTKRKAPGSDLPGVEMSCVRCELNQPWAFLKFSAAWFQLTMFQNAPM